MLYQFYKLDENPKHTQQALLESGHLVTPAVLKELNALSVSDLTDLRQSICENNCITVRRWEPYPFWVPVGSDDATLVQNEMNIKQIELDKLKQQAIDLITVRKNRSVWSQLYDEEQYPDIRQKIIDQVIEPMFNPWQVTQESVNEEGLKDIFVCYWQKYTAGNLHWLDQMEPVVKEWEKLFSLPSYATGFLALNDFATKLKNSDRTKEYDFLESLKDRICAMDPFESNKTKILLDFFEKIGNVPESERNDYIVTEILKLDRKGKLNYRQLIPEDMLPALRVVATVSTETSEGESFWF